MADQKPSQGRIVHYTLNADDAVQINRRRTTGSAIAQRIKNNSVPMQELDPHEPAPHQWPIGAQAHIGNEVSEGQVFPMIITAVWSDKMVSGQVFLDGNDTYWATSVEEGTSPRTWMWPPRV